MEAIFPQEMKQLRLESSKTSTRGKEDQQNWTRKRETETKLDKESRKRKEKQKWPK